MTITGMSLTARDVFIIQNRAKVGWGYRVDQWRCLGTHHTADCSGLQCLCLNQAGVHTECLNSEEMGHIMLDAGTTVSYAEALVTPGIIAVRFENNPVLPGHGHVVCCIGGGATCEAHDTADGVMIGHLSGRYWNVFGRWPGLAGFDVPAAPITLPPGPSGSNLISLVEGDSQMIFIPWKKSRVPGRLCGATLDIANKCVWLHNGAALAFDKPTNDPNLRVWKIGASRKYPNGAPMSGTILGIGEIYGRRNADGETISINTQQTSAPGPLVGIGVMTSDHGTFVGTLT